MSHRFAAALLFLLLLLTPPALRADSAADREIEYLLGYVEQSGARFIRSGKEYDSKAAAGHLRKKLSRAGARVKTPEDFVTGIATKSYLTGEAYRVRLPDGRERPTGAWLSEALADYRQRTKK